MGGRILGRTDQVQEIQIAGVESLDQNFVDYPFVDSPE
jgi:hypothetical protein